MSPHPTPMIAGVASAVSNGPMQALFADSIATGERSRYYTVLFVCYLSASTGGPLLAIILFLIHGNDWGLDSLRNVFLAGMGLELLAGLTYFFFRDDCALDEESDALPSGDVLPDGDALPGGDETGVAVHGKPLNSDSGGDEEAPAGRLVWLVPYVLFGSSLCFALGSGMTVKFFPLFFKNDCCLSPIEVNCVYLVLPLVMAAMSGAGTMAAKRIGRVQTMTLYKLVGIGLLVSMALLRDWVNPQSSPTPNQALQTGFIGATWQAQSWQAALPVHSPPSAPPATCAAAGGDNVSSGDPVSDTCSLPGRRSYPFRVLVVVVIYILRTGLMNCTYPLEESILMDYVPKQTRARWKALDSVGVFGWCGSAALGGYLADAHGYAFTFLITAAIQLAATIMQAMLMFVVPRKEARDTSGEAAAEADDGGLSPLDAGTPPTSINAAVIAAP